MESITRRSLLAGASAGLLQMRPQTALRAQANSAVVLGIIGTGGRGRRVGTYFAEDPRVRLGAICDLYPDRIDEAKTQIPGADRAKVYKDYRELLASAEIDAVLIATPVFLHPEHFSAAVNAKKHIYCEKPAGADVAGVKQLIASAKRADASKSIAFGFQQRHSPEYLAALKILRSGDNGETLMIRSDWLLGGARLTPFQSPYPPEQEKIRHWGAWKQYSGDFIVEQDCHGVDVLNWWAQAHPLAASGQGGRRKRAYGDNMDHLSVLYEYPGGLPGYLNATQLAVKNYWDVKEQVFGAEGVITVTRRYYEWFRGRDNVQRVDSKGDVTIDAVRVFVDRVVEGKPANEALSAAESTLTSLLGRLAVESGQRVTWEEMMKSA
jgi:predicted dehydrogenase